MFWVPGWGECFGNLVSAMQSHPRDTCPSLGWWGADFSEEVRRGLRCRGWHEQLTSQRKVREEERRGPCFRDEEDAEVKKQGRVLCWTTHRNFDSPHPLPIHKQGSQVWLNLIAFAESERLLTLKGPPWAPWVPRSTLDVIQLTPLPKIASGCLGWALLERGLS